MFEDEKLFSHFCYYEMSKKKIWLFECKFKDEGKKGKKGKKAKAEALLKKISYLPGNKINQEITITKIDQFKFDP